jgi:hypothetical protein
MKKLLSIILLSVVTTGCSLYQIDSQNDTTKYYPPKKSTAEVAYVEKSDRPYETIGTVIVTTERRQTLESVLPKMQYEAAIMGGDAFTDIRTDATGSWKKIQPKALLGNAYIRANYSAKVIVYTKDGEASAPAEPAPVEEVVTEDISAPTATDGSTQSQ